MDFSQLADPQTYVMLFTLAGLEIVLGIDNIVFITILCGRLPPETQPLARKIGLALALISRLGLLFVLGWIMGLKEPLFTVAAQEISGRDLILLGGGLFLIGKSTHEIYHDVEHVEDSHHADHHNEPIARPALSVILVQIVFLDIVFSLDSVITAVGMVSHIWIMATAMVMAVLVMILFAGPVGDFVQRHASVRILALAFLVLIGVLLVAEGFDQHLNRGYVYFAMGFALLIELINLRRQVRRKKLWSIHTRELSKFQPRDFSAYSSPVDPRKKE